GDVAVGKSVRHVPLVVEVRDLAVVGVVGVGNRVVTDDLVVDVRLSTPAGNIVELGEDRLHVFLGNVLGGVDTEASDTQIDHVVEIANDLILNVGAAGVQVGQVEEFAVLHLFLVVPVLDGVVAGAEVVVGVGGLAVPEQVGVLVLLPCGPGAAGAAAFLRTGHVVDDDRKSTRLNSSHVSISYAVFCLKK